jgi:DNA-binding response OmpR family regulator
VLLLHKVLIIEDDESIANLQKDYLELSGCIVRIETNGIDGLKALQEDKIDLLILDLMLPGIDGFAILNKIRDTLDIPVLIVSARQEELYKIKALGFGADDYITKPFSPAELSARVNSQLKRYERLKERFGKGKEKDRLIIRGLEIEKEARRVFINGNEVILAHKELELLLFLAENGNRVYGKEELFERIWGLDALGDASTVTVHVARIREKIEANPSKPQYIETVWGAGYRFKI